MVDYDGSNIPPEVIASLPASLQAQIPLWHESSRPNMFGSVAVCHTLACVGVALRLYARRMKSQPLWWDDWLIVIALLFNFAFVAVIVATTFYGFGRHFVCIVLNHPDRIPSGVHLSLIGAMLNYPPLTFTKYSVLCLYHRIFSGASVRFKWFCITAGILSTCHGLAAILTIIFECLPGKSHWELETPANHCMYYYSTLRLFAAANVVTDAVILILPMPSVWSMTTSRCRRIQISSTFLLGSIVTVVSIVRAYYAGLPAIEVASDTTWESPRQFVWCSAETGIGILAGCLPVMRPVLNKMLYGSVEGSSTRARSLARSAALHGDGGLGTNLVTIGGSVIPLQSDAALPGGGAGTRRVSVITFVGAKRHSSGGPSHETV